MLVEPLDSNSDQQAQDALVLWDINRDGLNCQMMNELRNGT